MKCAYEIQKSYRKDQVGIVG